MPFSRTVAESGLYIDYCFVEIGVGKYNLDAISLCVLFECEDKLRNKIG